MLTLVAFTGLSDHNGETLGAIGDASQGYGWPDAMCTKTAPIPLARSGLPLYAVYKTGERGLGSFDNGAACWVATRVAVRLHVTIGKNARPTAGQLALRSGKKLRPIAFVDWTPKRVAVYFSDDCHE
jgi:hypothetical protein